jgi:acyl carrier protein/nodulation protein F
MDQVATQAIAIFQARAAGGSGVGPHVGLDTCLADLRIESLDLALILLDIEDAFGIDFAYDPGKAGDAFATVGDVVARVQALVEAKQCRPASAVAAGLTRSRSRWVTASGRA